MSKPKPGSKVMSISSLKSTETECFLLDQLVSMMENIHQRILIGLPHESLRGLLSMLPVVTFTGMASKSTRRYLSRLTIYLLT